MTLLLTICGTALPEPTYDCGLTSIEVGVTRSVLLLVTRHSAELVRASRFVSGTRWRTVLAWRAITRNWIESLSFTGIEYVMFDSVPVRVIHKFCGLLVVPPKTRRWLKYVTAPG